MVPVTDKHFKEQLQSVENLILSEVNVKEMEYLTGSADILVKKIKPNFKSLGPKYGKLMKQIALAIAGMTKEGISQLENNQLFQLNLDGNTVEISLEDVEISTEDIPGWLIANEGNTTVALDVTITEELKQEGLARELVNRIQNIRKDKGFEVTDKIRVSVVKTDELDTAILNNYSYICAEILAESLELIDQSGDENLVSVELTDEYKTSVIVEKAG
jgi:isoleucyl-tRNA synthetase